MRASPSVSNPIIGHGGDPHAKVTADPCPGSGPVAEGRRIHPGEGRPWWYGWGRYPGPARMVLPFLVNAAEYSAPGRSWKVSPSSTWCSKPARMIGRGCGAAQVVPQPRFSATWRTPSMVWREMRDPFALPRRIRHTVLTWTPAAMATSLSVGLRIPLISLSDSCRRLPVEHPSRRTPWRADLAGATCSGAAVADPVDATSRETPCRSRPLSRSPGLPVSTRAR